MLLLLQVVVEAQQVIRNSHILDCNCNTPYNTILFFKFNYDLTPLKTKNQITPDGLTSKNMCLYG